MDRKVDANNRMSEWWCVVMAPWCGITRPQSVGRLMNNGPTWAVCLTFIVGLIISMAGANFATLWNDTAFRVLAEQLSGKRTQPMAADPHP